ncbi:MAG: hypothetical protein JRI84_15250, partial [Deltaproteobacteria bacterium]|nr:hypothetical protein [Deltaproteobacteria bacterium]
MHGDLIVLASYYGLDFYEVPGVFLCTHHYVKRLIVPTGFALYHLGQAGLIGLGLALDVYCGWLVAVFCSFYSLPLGSSEALSSSQHYY